MRGCGIAALLLAAGACAQPPVPQVRDGVVPGTIGVSVRQERSIVVVEAVREGSAAARSGVRVGDIVLSYNGEAVVTSRQFNRLVVDSPPGSLARLELLREGRVQMLELPVGELYTTPRA